MNALGQVEPPSIGKVRIKISETLFRISLDQVEPPAIGEVRIRTSWPDSETLFRISFDQVEPPSIGEDDRGFPGGTRDRGCDGTFSR